MSLNIGHRLGVFRQSAGLNLSRDLRAKSYIFPLSPSRLNHTAQSLPLPQNRTKTRSRESRRINSKIASGSLLILCANSVTETGTTCTASSGNNICARKLHHTTKQGTVGSLARRLWKRTIHTQHNKPGEDADNGSTTNKILNQQTKDREPASLNRNLRERLPTLHHFHRPTKEELLAAATGFWSRLRVRFKWFSIRSVRPFTLDEIGALFSWVLLGHILWIILGTTTFFSLLIFAINTVFAQETLARWVGNYLTKSSGVKVVFESAIVPKWRDGVITFKNVFVSRRPGHGEGRVSKGSSKTAAAAAAAAAALSEPKESDMDHAADEEDTNYTQFDVSIDTVNVTLSFTKWLNGKGLLRDVEVRGIRGVIDRTHVHWTNTDLDPKSYRHEHNPGDFEIDSFKMEDLLVTIYQPNNFRPFSVSIFSCDLPQLRKQWLFYDFMSANMISGSFDNSLFTIHPRQTHSFTGAQLNINGEENGGTSPWKKQSRIRIDGLNIDHLNRGVEGPFSWIHEGVVDIVADIMFPTDDSEGLAKVVSDFYDRFEATVTSNRSSLEENNQFQDGQPHIPPLLTSGEEEKRFLVTDLRIHLTNVRAVVPLFTRDLSYINNALIRPIVAYINSRRTFIPVNCRLIKRLSDFDGSWTVFDSGLMDDLSAATYDAFARDVVDEQARTRRFKKVGFWSLQLAAQALFLGMAGNIV
ncbi:mitochondrial distribution and morphology proteins-domain-containing protein [Talaromyces proteolyticus]|uniref:Mitochondrial distribution and morphology proteins-domain-containing protein n=1 Tax=Talaromyces proteolyticus TaxID=1131652 RepID=A0AAD4PXC4_9EURO|nr:mitochondrial distribution and morphology proteins-domain-containing protein [Talaromyces proteolyticus]KAH8693520.1 mitochondrial distribution and morphology proteins-domain-containing protein [Talaromyces proteolyticus]